VAALNQNLAGKMPEGKKITEIVIYKIALLPILF